MTTATSTLLPGEPQAAVLFGFPVPDSFSGPSLCPITDSRSTSSSYEGNTLSECERFKLRAFLTFVLMGPDGEEVAERILSYLDKRERKSNLTASERDELRVSWLTVKFAFYDGPENPWLRAFCRVFGTTPERMDHQLQCYEAFMLGAPTPPKFKKPVFRLQGYAELPPKKMAAAVGSHAVDRKVNQ